MEQFRLVRGDIVRKLLCLKNESNEWPEIPSEFLDHCDVIQVDDVVDALQLLGSEQFDGIYLDSCQPEHAKPPPDATAPGRKGRRART